ncbi:MAG: hypothetical protein QOD30_1066 [Actinomycetota bacterium]|jgi:hypothetical protein|nr:hypothetical protein [Actinomycetota bacterium]
MRPTLGVLAAVLGAALAALIVSEYEFVGFTPWAAGLAIGVLVGEVLATGGRLRGRAVMALAGVLSAASVLWGEWLESESGVESYAKVAFAAAVVAAVVAAWSVRPSTSSGS